MLLKAMKCTRTLSTQIYSTHLLDSKTLSNRRIIETTICEFFVKTSDADCNLASSGTRFSFPHFFEVISLYLVILPFNLNFTMFAYYFMSVCTFTFVYQSLVLHSVN